MNSGESFSTRTTTTPCWFSSSQKKRSTRATTSKSWRALAQSQTAISRFSALARKLLGQFSREIATAQGGVPSQLRLWKKGEPQLQFQSGTTRDSIVHALNRFLSPNVIEKSCSLLRFSSLIKSELPTVAGYFPH